MYSRFVPSTGAHPVIDRCQLRAHPPPCILFPPHSPSYLLHSPSSFMTAGTATRAIPDEIPPAHPSMKTVRVVIKGRVQGVFYRDWTVANASQLELKGWVRNRRDGSVEALFSGSADKVEEMEQRCRRGPPDSMVTGFQVFPADDEHLGTKFERIATA